MGFMTKSMCFIAHKGVFKGMGDGVTRSPGMLPLWGGTWLPSAPLGFEPNFGPSFPSWLGFHWESFGQRIQLPMDPCFPWRKRGSGARWWVRKQQNHCGHG